MGLLPLLDVVDKLIDRVIPDPAERRAFQVQLAELADKEAQREHDEMMGQMDVNKVEASNTNLFVSGWRPFIGWTGGIGVAYSFILEPFMSFIARILGYTGDFPTLDSGQLMVLVTGMLGFGGLRSFDKLKGTAGGTPLPVAPDVAIEPQPVEKKKFLPFDIPGIKGI